METTISETAIDTSRRRPIAQLRAWLSDSVARCRSQRWFGPLFRVSVAEDIAKEVAEVETAARNAAEEAEIHDNTAEQEIAAARAALESALKDGLDSSDASIVRSAICRLQRARTSVRLSAKRDHEASELLAAS